MSARSAPIGASIAAIAFALLGSVPSGAAEPVRPPEISASFVALAPGAGTRRLTMGSGKSTIVDLPEDASEVFVGNPKVANAIVRSARRLYVLGVDNGQTTIFAMDKTGRQIATLEVTVGRDVAELRAILRTAMPTSNIAVNTVADTIILTGEVDSALEAEKAYDIAYAFVGKTAYGGGTSGSGASTVSFSGVQVVRGDLVNSITIRGRDQVMLKVTIAEVQRKVLKQLGLTPSTSWGSTASGFKGLQTLVDNSPSGVAVPATAPVFSFLTGGKTAFAEQIQAYERNGVARVLAEPTVTAISGESAKFTAGGTVPTAGSSSIDPATGRCTVQVQYQNYGVTLNFTPVVLSEGRIQLHLATEVTEIDETSAIKFACSNSVGFRTRKNETTVELPSGGSIASAGLIQQVSRNSVAGMPGLMNLPILGQLFRSRDYQREETELMIVVTPYIAKSVRADQIARPDDGFMDSSDPQAVLLGRLNKIYATKSNPKIVESYRGAVGFIND